MRLFKKYIYIIMSFMLALFFLNNDLYASNNIFQTKLKQFISFKVIDKNGIAISNAEINVGNSYTYYSNRDGLAIIEAKSNDEISIFSSGYDKFIIVAEELAKDDKIELVKSNQLLTSKDQVYLPFASTVKKRYLTSSSNVIKGDELEKYPTIDIRNSFTGLANGLSVDEQHGAPGMQAEERLGSFGISEKIRLYMRGRNPIFIIDDVPTDVNEIQLDQEEIESATIIKDITAKAMFGPQAADGIIYIRTRRGKVGKKVLKVNVESGVSVIDRFPEWVNGADYARLNNIARENSGLDPLYSQEDIMEYGKNNPYDLYHPSNDYRGMMLDKNKAFRKVNVSSSGGSDNIQYYSNLGYSGEGDIYKIGAESDFSRLNARSNLDIKINDFIKLQFNIFAGLTSRRSPNYGYDSDFGDDNSNDSSLDLIEFHNTINDLTTISPIAFPVFAGYDSTSNTPWYGVDPIFNVNPIGKLESCGYYTELGRTGATSIDLDYDMTKLIKGLKSRTSFSFDVLNLTRIGKAELYTAYNVTPSVTAGGADTILLTKRHDGIDMAGQAKLHDYYYQRFGGYQNFSLEREIGDEGYLQSSLTYYLSIVTRNQIKEPERQQNVVLSGLYVHKNKYSIQGVLNYSGSTSLPQHNRYEFFPSLGLGWVLSEEDFLSNSKAIDYLKLRGEIGILGYESFSSPYLYNDIWTSSTGSSFGASPTGYWFGSDTESPRRSVPSRIGNENLAWEKRKEVTVGLDALMFNNKLQLELNYYNNVRDGILTSLNYSVPLTTGIASTSTYANYNKYQYSGFEGSLSYTNSLGELKYSIGGNATIQNTKILKYDEPNYRFDYQKRTGGAADAYRGLTYLGRFATDEEALEVPQLFDEVIGAGDFKYKDMNGDGEIDDNDVSTVGHTSPRLLYALNLKFNYRNFDLTIVADGRAFYDIPLSSRFFKNGWGDNTYSQYVQDNLGGEFPKLTYYQVSNNFKTSDFWLTKGGYFKIQNVELAYNLPSNVAKTLFSRNVRLFVRGANLLTVTNVKYVDPESPNSGVTMYPLFKTFTAGLNLNF